jgi:ATP-dependent DNA helicase DinG
MEEVFGPGGLIAKHHPNYEYRPGQVEMAEAVNDTLKAGGVALIEAGTGTGKTLAYLIPALACEQRVIVSTATKNLQEQLYKKDIPFLEQIIPRKFTTACMKGRSNYVCLHRLKGAETTPILEGLDEVDYFDAVRQWAATTETGDRAELTELPEELSFWPHVDARAETCLGQKCPEFDNCFITRMRQKAQEADIVIVNHHLFFADLAMRGGDYGAVLPDYATVIFDEAHEIEDVAATYFGCSVSNYRVIDLLQDAQKLAITEPERASAVSQCLARITQRSDSFWMSLTRSHADASGFNGRRGDGRGAASRQGDSGDRRGGGQLPSIVGLPEGRYPISSRLFLRKEAGGYNPTAVGEAYIALTNSLDRLTTELQAVKDPPPEAENIVRRAESLKFELEFVVIGDDPTFVYWLEKRGRGIFLNATPIDVSTILNEKLFGAVRSAVLTSATMTAGGTFGFLKGRIGVDRAREVVVESHFDFKKQAVLYLPDRMPDPRTREFLTASVEEIIKILEVTEGRAFVLFTSVASMRETYELVKPRIAFPTLIQGQGAKAGLLERFRKTKGAVLFATASFWQGIDVQGDALSCVIISKLPFSVPTDPVVAARQNYIEENGGSSFYEYSVPEAIITLKQGLGRLIRSTTDRGVLSILDPRLRTKSYGRLFLQSFPSCQVTSNLEEAAAVFKR